MFIECCYEEKVDFQLVSAMGIAGLVDPRLREDDRINTAPPNLRLATTVSLPGLVNLTLKQGGTKNPV